MRIISPFIGLSFGVLLLVFSCQKLEENLGLNATLYNTSVFPYPQFSLNKEEWECGDTLEIEIQLGDGLGDVDFWGCDLVYPEAYSRMWQEGSVKQSFRLLVPDMQLEEIKNPYLGVRIFYPPLKEGGKVVGYYLFDILKVAPCKFGIKESERDAELKVWDPDKKVWQDLPWGEPTWH